MIIPRNVDINFELEECKGCTVCELTVGEVKHENFYGNYGTDYILGCKHISACRRIRREHGFEKENV